ncbi:TRAP transporter large permease subunit [Salinisphaera sp. LB1]|uniref:TRAP transporter large permease subunit n=1 Tax=Salinisphaera sp. LB1 TaxID=2183911 RepID=UPI000D70876F|nr:TRAP transporter large permease subunit [Salinisphaera sp. LB1]AWN16382.1 TRAP-type C4-dicarboxylate transport system, large permease component [Salinisphaera sp. LB1]
MATPYSETGPAPSDPHAGDRPTQYSRLRSWLITLPTAVLLLLAIVFGTSAFIHGQLLSLGGHIWRDYNVLRADMPKPHCNPNPDIAARVKKAQQRKADSDSLFDAGPAHPKALRQSLIAQRQECRQSFQFYRYNRKMTATATLRAFRAVELGVGRINSIGQNWQPYILVLLILFGGAIALALAEQIALRPPASRLDHRVSAGMQLATHLAMTVSALAWARLDGGGDLLLDGGWAGGFAVLAGVAAWRLLRVPGNASNERSVFHAALSVPLYCWLALISILYFFCVERYLAGPVIQLTKMIRFADLYTSIGLYVWVGMMLKHTRIAELVFGLFRSWEMRPEFVVIIVVLASAWPTAYTGASGIFVLAIGAVIYQELRIAGTYRQLAIASTAMSGSMGVVLNPCLMVVIIAALNRQVTTDQLYGWGLYVFALSALLFCGFIYLTRKSRPHLAKPDAALPQTLRAIVPLLPYLLIGAAVILLYSHLLGQRFNEFSAPVILPLMLIALLAYDRWRAHRLHADALTGADRGETAAPSPAPAGFANALRAATAETSTLIGALLMLMTLSIVFGGVMERSGVMNLFPAHLGNVWEATAILVCMLVIIGMIMDPYGAIILVSATIAPIAYHNGINPVHFWMIVLVAFELGYLSPPVALNRLLTRQVVGEAEYAAAHAEAADDPGFWRRHESLLLPMAVMASSLLLVAFAPLVFNAVF